MNPNTETSNATSGAATSAERAALLTSRTVYDPLNPDRVTDTYGPMHKAYLTTGYDYARDHVRTTYDEGAPVDGTVYGLPTKTVTSAYKPSTEADLDPVTVRMGYDAVVTGDSTGWALRAATTTTTQMGSSPNSSVDLVRTIRYDANGAVIESRLPLGAAGADARSTLTTYYTVGGSGGCGSSALAGLVCKVEPAAQPSTGNALPVVTTTYNLYSQPLVVTETAGSTVRTTTTSYDVAGRPLTSAIAVTPSGAGGTTVPSVTYAYSSTTGLPTTATANSTTLTTGYDTLGRVTSYSDTSGNSSATGYDISGNVVSFNDGKGTTSYTIDSSTERRGKVTSQTVGVSPSPDTFTASYDEDGHLKAQTYPNGVVATTTFDNAGTDSSLVYSKSGVTLPTYLQYPNAQGNTAIQWAGMTGIKPTWQYFGYDDAAGRLIRTHDDVGATTTSQCTVRLYTLDKDSNRSTLTSYPDDGTVPADGHCTTATAPTTVSSTFDQADRITNTGYAYDTLGRTTTVPSADAKGIGSHAAITGNLTVGYYINDLVASQAQGSTTLSFTLDPSQNRFATSSDGTTTTTNHYADASDSPAWTSTSGTAWSRSLAGINGDLAGTVDNSGTVTLDITNLHGDIVGTMADNTSLTTWTDTGTATEYGHPATSPPHRTPTAGSAPSAVPPTTSADSP